MRIRIGTAAILYFVTVFAVGFALGPIRIFVLEPNLGATIATLCEAPFLIVAMIITSRWIPNVMQMPKDVAALVVMGLGALVLQQIADIAVGIGLRGISATEYLAHFSTVPGLIYLALLVVFAMMPLLCNAAAARSGYDKG